MLISVALFAFFLGIALGLAVLWMFTTEILPWLILIYIVCLAVRFLVTSRKSEGGSKERKASGTALDKGPSNAIRER